MAKKPNHVLLGVVIIGIVAAIAVIEFSKPDVESTSAGKGFGTNIGDRATDFTLTSLDGEEMLLSDFRGKAVLLNFWASWCPPCRTEMPEFESVFTEHKDDFVVVAVNLQEDVNVVRSFSEELGLTFPIVMDPDSTVKTMYNVFTQPVSFFIDRNGRIVDKKLGALTIEEIEQKVGDLLDSLVTVDTEEDEILQLDDGTKYIIHPDTFLSGGPPKDGIPSIDNPKFVDVSDANLWLPDDELGLGIEYNGETRFYPFRILVNHEMVNDFFGDDAILITYCPLCFTGIAFDRTIGGEAVEFGVSGKLYNSELVMYDRKTDSYWPQSLGKAVLGPLTGHVLKKLSSDTVTWGDWKRVHSGTKVLSTDTGFFRSYTGRNPYGMDGDYTSINLQFPLENRDGRLPEYEIVYGISVAGEFKAYKQSDLFDMKEITDVVGGKNVTLRLTEVNSARAALDSGEDVIVETLFWFAWAAFHPETEIYMSN